MSEYTAEDIKRMYEDAKTEKYNRVQDAYKEFSDKADRIWHLAFVVGLIRDGKAPWQEGYND